MTHTSRSRSRVIVALLSLAIFVLLAPTALIGADSPGADSENSGARKQYKLKVSVAPSGSGVVLNADSSGKAAGRYDEGSNPVLKAMPAEGFRFGHWEGDASGNEAQVSITKMDGAKSAMAVFQPVLNVLSPYGKVEPAAGEHVFAAGQEVTVSISEPIVKGPDGVQYVCKGWQGQGSVGKRGNAMSTTFVLGKPSVITWVWAPQYDLSVESVPAEGGRVTLKDGKTAAAGWYESGQVVAVRAIPEPGYKFDYWGNDPASAANRAAVPIEAAMKLTAHFSPIASKTVLSIVSAYGQPTPAVGDHAYEGPQTVTVSMPDPSAADGPGTQYVCVGWQAEGSAKRHGKDLSTTFKLTKPTKITWIWEPRYNLSVGTSPSEGGGINLKDGKTPAEGWYAPGKTIVVRAVPQPHYQFEYWDDDPAMKGNPAELEMTAPRKLTAHFGPDKAELAAAAENKQKEEESQSEKDAKEAKIKEAEAAKAKKAEEKRLAEEQEAKQIEQAKAEKAEKTRVAEDAKAKKAEEKRLAEEQEAKQIEQAKAEKAEKARVAEEAKAKKAEEKRLAEEQEAKRIEEAKAQKSDQERIAQEEKAKRIEQAKAEKARIAEEAKAKKAEEKRLADEQEAKQIEEAKAQKAEQKRLALEEKAKRIEQVKAEKAEKARLAEAAKAKKAEEKRLAEEQEAKQNEEAKAKKAEERRLAEEQEAKRVEQAKAEKAEEKRIAQEKKAKKTEEAKTVEVALEPKPVAQVSEEPAKPVVSAAVPALDPPVAVEAPRVLASAETLPPAAVVTEKDPPAKPEAVEPQVPAAAPTPPTMTNLASEIGYRLIPGDTVEITYFIRPRTVVQPDYVYTFDVGDELTVEFTYDKTYNFTRMVRPDGRITVPLHGDLMVLDKTTTWLQKEVETSLAKVLANPQCSVNVTKVGRKEDELKEAITTNQGRQKDILVRPDGYLSFPIINEVLGAGKTIPELYREINLLYRKEYPNLETSIQLKGVTNIGVYVAGEVGRPGNYPIFRPVSPLQAIALAGGALPTGNLKKVIVITMDENRRPTRQVVDLKALIKEGKGNTLVGPDSIIYVPKTFVAAGDLFVEQYINKLLMFQGYSLDFTYLLNNENNNNNSNTVPVNTGGTATK